MAKAPFREALGRHLLVTAERKLVTPGRKWLMVQDQNTPAR